MLGPLTFKSICFIAVRMFGSSYLSDVAALQAFATSQVLFEIYS